MGNPSLVYARSADDFHHRVVVRKERGRQIYAACEQAGKMPQTLSVKSKSSHESQGVSVVD